MDPEVKGSTPFPGTIFKKAIEYRECLFGFFAFSADTPTRSASGTITHQARDLQEPLRQIVAFTQFLDERYRPNLDEAAQELMEFIIEGGRRMQALIQDLLTFSRAGTSEKPRESTKLEDVLDKLIQNLKSRIDENGAAITHGPLPTLKADASQLAQVFQNLIANALKFRGTQPPQIHFTPT